MWHKWIPPSRDPACHSSNNKSNKHGKRPAFFCIFFFVFHFWMQTLWFRIYSLHQSCGTDSGCRNATVQYKQPISDKAWKDIAFCSSFASVPLFFLLLCLDCFQTRTRQRGGVVREDGTALQYMMLMRLFCGISLPTYQRGQHSGSFCPAKNRSKTRGNKQLGWGLSFRKWHGEKGLLI